MPDPKLTYDEACHAIQSGAAHEMAIGRYNTQPKHLRVGINIAMCDHVALIRLLIGKGIITDEEYRQAITEEANREVDRYEERNDGIKFR